MTLVRTGELLRSAAADGTAVAAFNVITLEHAEAIARAAELSVRPVILQISENAVRFHMGQVAPIAAACVAVAQAASVPISLHLDHVTEVELLRQASAAGFSSVMFDAAALNYGDNVLATRAAADYAHGEGLWVEAELGYVGGKPDAPASAHAAGVRTDPAEAAAYVAATGVDSLAVAVGSSHAMTTRTASLDHALIATLAAAVPVPLVLHGSSGVGDSNLRAAVEHGIRKVNVGTALNVAFTSAVRATLASDAELTDPRKYLSVARDSMVETIRSLIDVVSAADTPFVAD